MGIDDVFAVIAEGTRRQILERLRDGDRAVGELVIELQVSQPTVSKHLKVLREAGLVTMRAQGQKRYYALRAEPLDQVRSWLGGFEARNGVDGPSADSPVPAGAATDGAEHVSDPDAPAAAAAAAAAAAIAATAPGTTEPDAGEPAPDVLAAAVLAGSAAASASDSRAVSLATPVPGTARPIGRTMGRAAERAVDLLSQLRRRRDPS